MTTSPISHRDFVLGIFSMLIAALFVALASLCGKQLTTFSGLSIVVFIRFFIPMIILIWVGAMLVEAKITFNNWRIHLLRSLFTVLSQYCLFYYLMHGSLMLGTLLFSTSGFFLPFLGYICFKIPVKRKTLLATMVSFIGVAFILNPTQGVSWLTVIGVLGGFLNACSQITMHHCSKKIDTFSMTLIMFSLSSLYTLIILLVLGKFGTMISQMVYHPATGLWLTILFLGIFSISNQSMRTKAYRYVNNPASLTPFFYMAIVFAGILDWVVYHDVPQWNAYFGMILIFIGGFIMYRSAKMLS
ncbi:MAG: DMT family transporter [Desulfobacteraceae bacterium]|nr:DMT family transporter [Desulfobacteraceae bacterium]